MVVIGQMCRDSPGIGFGAKKFVSRARPSSGMGRVLHFQAESTPLARPAPPALPPLSVHSMLMHPHPHPSHPTPRSHPPPPAQAHLFPPKLDPNLISFPAIFFLQIFPFFPLLPANTLPSAVRSHSTSSFCASRLTISRSLHFGISYHAHLQPVQGIPSSKHRNSIHQSQAQAHRFKHYAANNPIVSCTLVSTRRAS